MAVILLPSNQFNEKGTNRVNEPLVHDDPERRRRPRRFALLVSLLDVLWVWYRNPYREARRRANREIRHN